MDVLVKGRALPTHKGDYDQEYAFNTPRRRYELQLRTDRRADKQSWPTVVIAGAAKGVVVALILVLTGPGSHHHWSSWAEPHPIPGMSRIHSPRGVVDGVRRR